MLYLRPPTAAFVALSLSCAALACGGGSSHATPKDSGGALDAKVIDGAAGTPSDATASDATVAADTGASPPDATTTDTPSDVEPGDASHEDGSEDSAAPADAPVDSSTGVEDSAAMDSGLADSAPSPPSDGAAEAATDSGTADSGTPSGCVPDGGGAMGVCVQVLATVTEEPEALAVSAAGVYWLTSDSLYRAPLTGGSPAALVTGLTFPSGIALDGSFAYWIADSNISKVPLQGGAVVPIIDGQVGLSQFAITGTSIYFTEGSPGAVLKCGLDGSGLTALASGQVLQGAPGPIAINPTNVYFGADFADESAVQAISLGDGGISTLTTGQFDLAYLSLDATGLYWIDETAPSTLMKLAFGSTFPMQLASAIFPSGLVTDGTTVYFAQEGPAQQAAGSISKVPATGGVVSVLVGGQTAQLIAIDATSVYWFNELFSAQSGTAWQLMRASPR